MPDPALSAALREARASAPVDTVEYHTLELYHPAFSAPVRVVRDRDPLEARLEAGAPRDAGLVVTFLAYGFDFTPPELTTTGVPQATVVIDNVDSAIEAQLDLAVASGQPVVAIYRSFLSDTLLEGPENDPPIQLTLTSSTSNPFTVRGSLSFPNLLDRTFPREEYTLARFPALAQ
jgi:hypothetical protein